MQKKMESWRSNIRKFFLGLRVVGKNPYQRMMYSGVYKAYTA